MLKGIRFEILRGLEANGRINVPLAEKPIRVATMINEARFNEDHFMVHGHTVFFEDRLHDWNWDDGKFRYYTRVATKADVLVVYEIANVEPEPKFDSMTGEPLPKK